jgi:hypothetical protein
MPSNYSSLCVVISQRDKPSCDCSQPPGGGRMELRAGLEQQVQGNAGGEVGGVKPRVEETHRWRLVYQVGRGT